MDKIRTKCALAAILLATLVLAGFIFAFYVSKTSKKPIDPPHTTTELSTDTVANPQRYQVAIENGIGYLNRTADSISPLQWLILDYLQRKFSLDPKLSATHRSIQPPSNEVEAADFRIFYRIIDPDALIETLPLSSASPMRQMMMSAAHCDHIPLPPDFESLLRRNLESGGYDLTHIGISLEFMKENGCTLPAEQDKQMREEVAVAMVNLVDDPGVSEDLKYEAIAFIIHLGRRDLVQARWFDSIVAAQNSDGGWSVLKQDSASNDHATVLALWSLLGFVNPEAPELPLLRRPTR